MRSAARHAHGAAAVPQVTHPTRAPAQSAPALRHRNLPTACAACAPSAAPRTPGEGWQGARHGGAGGTQQAQRWQRLMQQSQPRTSNTPANLAQSGASCSSVSILGPSTMSTISSTAAGDGRAYDVHQTRAQRQRGRAARGAWHHAGHRFLPPHSASLPASCPLPASTNEREIPPPPHPFPSLTGLQQRNQDLHVRLLHTRGRKGQQHSGSDRAQHAAGLGQQAGI